MKYLLVLLCLMCACATVKPEIVFEMPPQEVWCKMAVEINGVKGEWELCDDGEMWDSTRQVYVHFFDKYPSIWITTYYKIEGNKMFIGLLRFNGNTRSHQPMDEYGKYSPDYASRKSMVSILKGKFSIQWIEVKTVRGAFTIDDLKGKWL